MSSLVVTDREVKTLEQIWNQYTKDPSVLEFEFRFTNNIDRNMFTKLLSRLQALPDYSEMLVDEYMTVSYIENNKQLHIRHTIPHEELSNYCNRMFSYQTYDTIFKYPLYIDGAPQNITLEEYPVRCNLKYEVPWSRASNAFAVTEHVDPNTARLIEKESKLNISDKLKKFRNIKRFSFTTTDGYFRIDCSMVKSNSEHVNHITAAKDMHSSPAQFEIEMECLVKSADLDFDTMQFMALQHIHVIIQSIQDSLYVLPANETSKVQAEYENWINEVRQDLIKKHEIKTRFETINGQSTFVSPKPVSISRSHLRPKNKINIIHNYTVTDKADGESALLYVSKSGKIYVINHLLQLQDTGIINTDYVGSLFNGELITRTKDGMTCYDYMGYDAYVVQNRSYFEKNLSSLESDVDTRLKQLHKFIGSASFTYKSGSRVSHPCRLLAKTFYQTTPEKTIFELARGIWTNRDSFRYKLDGLIFTPADKPVAFSDKHSDYLAAIHRTWSHNIKWKPSEENTIDFLVSIDSKIHHDARGIRYRNVSLYVGDHKDKVYGLSLFSWKDSGQVRNKTRWRVESDSHSVVLAENKHEVVSDTVVECRYDFSEPPEYRWKPLRTRHDKTAHYKTSRHTQKIQYEVFQRLVQGRSRSEDSRTIRILQKQFAKVGWIKKHQKMTQQIAQNLVSHVKNPADIPHNIQSGNNVSVANSIWNLIQHPVTVDDITGEKYYTATTKKVNDTMYRKYHNQIKGLLYQISNTKKRPKLLLDIGSGQGGDIMKWIRTKFGLVIGVDKFKQNVERAKKRLRNLKSIEKEKIHFFTADMSQRLENDISQEDRDTLRQLDKGEALMYDVISCQFAIHYFFKNADVWSGFMRNINEYLKPNGTFIGTCMNGGLVDASFKESSGTISGPFGRLTQKYNSEDFNTLANPLGQKIETFIESIGTTNDEYLVHMEWFIRQMKLHNIHLHEPSNHPIFLQATDHFGNIYSSINQKMKINLPEDQKAFSFLNQYFIFRRGKADTQFKYAHEVWAQIPDASKTMSDMKLVFRDAGYIVDDTFVDKFSAYLGALNPDRTDTESTANNTTAFILHSIHKYKLIDLQTLAVSQNVEIKKIGKSKKEVSRTKKELYNALMMKTNNDASVETAVQENNSEGVIEWFYSKSKAKGDVFGQEVNWRRYISNFQNVPNGLKWDMQTFPNIEHAFHYEKYKRTNKPELKERYVGITSSFPNNGQAKVFSGKKAMKENGVTLDVQRWNRERVDVNAQLLQARLEQDPKFKNILTEIKHNNIHLYHYERCGRSKPSFWGAMEFKDGSGIIGNNMLGKQMMALDV